MIKAGTGPGAESNNGLVLIQIKSINENKESKETIWAKPLGNDLYEIRGSLHVVTGFNAKDVVKAVTSPDETIPSVLEVTRSSGYKTLHVAFSDATSVLQQQAILSDLEKWKAKYEMAFERFYTIEVNPEGDYRAICEHFKSLKIKGLLMYEPDVDINALYRYRFSGDSI